MKRILFGMFPAWGHVAPTVAIAQELQNRGQEVAYAAHPSLAGLLEKAGLETLPSFDWGETSVRSQEYLRRRGADLGWFFRVARGRPSMTFIRGLVEGVKRLRERIGEFRPDVMVNDLLFTPGPIAAELEGIPWAGSCPYILPNRRDDLPPAGSGLACDAPRNLSWRLLGFLARRFRAGLHRAINRKRREFGLQDSAHPFSDLSPWLTLTYVTEAFEFPRPLLGRQVHYIGPSISRNRGDHGISFPWDWLDERPLVLVSLGTIFMHHGNFLRGCAEASRGRPWQMVIKVGPGFDVAQVGDRPRNVRFVTEIPQLELLKRVSVMVSHAGTSTVLEALAEGVPLIVAPAAFDQPDTAARVVRAGAGIRLDLRRDGAKRIRASLVRLFEEPSFRESAKRLAADFARCDAPVVGADLIERLIETRRPVLRENGQGPTIYAPKSQWPRTN